MTASLGLAIVAAGAPAFVQDGGRTGVLHMGVPPGGALVPALLARANAAAGNPWSAPAIEAFGALTVRALARPLTLALDGVRVELAPGEQATLPRPEGARVRYLAVRGGFEVPRVLGGAGTLASAAFGGFLGRALRRGDTLAVATRGVRPERALPAPRIDAIVRVLAGPDAARFAMDAFAMLCASTYRVAPASDRVGARLEGPAIERADDDDGLSAPMVRGAVEVPRDGQLIVLGPDHPTTGGYPVLAVVIRADQGALFARRPGAPVRFAAVSLIEARAAWREHADTYALDDVSVGP